MKKGILLLFLLFGFTCLNPAIGNELTEDYFNIAQNYYENNNYQKALEYLELIKKIEPTNQKANELKDKIIPQGQEEIIKTLNTAQMLNSTTEKPDSIVILEIPQADTEKMAYDAQYYNNKGQEFYDNKEYDSAIEYFYKSASIDKKNPVTYNNLGMAYWKKGCFAAAIKYFKKANGINRSYTQPLVNLGNLYGQLKDKDKQIYYLQKAVSINPNDFLAYFWLGEYYKSQGLYSKAIANYKETVKINPQYAQAYLNLGISFFETEQFNYSLIAFKQYLDICQNSDYAYYLMARTSLANSRYADAKTFIEKAILINNKDNYQFELGKINYYLEDNEAALKIFKTLIETQDSADIFNYIGLCYYKMKNIQLAILNFNNAIKTDSQRPIYYYNLAQCYKSMGDKKNYVKYANDATKITPVNYQDYIDLSYIYYDNGNAGYAINTLNNGIVKFPDVKSLYLSKLKIYESLSDTLHYNETRNLIESRFNDNEEIQKKK